MVRSDEQREVYCCICDTSDSDLADLGLTLRIKECPWKYYSEAPSGNVNFELCPDCLRIIDVLEALGEDMTLILWRLRKIVLKIRHQRKDNF